VPLFVERLAANPPVAQAWALVHGLDLTALIGFGAGTPVVLLQDTLVTDHGYGAVNNVAAFVAAMGLVLIALSYSARSTAKATKV